MAKEILIIDWRHPRKTSFGKNYETMCMGVYNGIEVAQNRFIRGDVKTGDNDISYKILGASGWVKYERFKELLLKEDKRRAPLRDNLRARGITPLSEKL